MHIKEVNQTHVVIGQNQIKEVENFTYLGSIINKDENVDVDVRCRIGKAALLFQRMRNIWTTSNINHVVKIHLYTNIALPTVLYG